MGWSEGGCVGLRGVAWGCVVWCCLVAWVCVGLRGFAWVGLRGVAWVGVGLRICFACVQSKCFPILIENCIHPSRSCAWASDGLISSDCSVAKSYGQNKRFALKTLLIQADLAPVPTQRSRLVGCRSNMRPHMRRMSYAAHVICGNICGFRRMSYAAT